MSAPGIARHWLLASAVLCAAGAVAHLAIPVGGPSWYDAFGAPPALGHMAAMGLARPAITCAAIALVLGGFAAYGFSALGHGFRLPARRFVLALIGLGLSARAVGFVFVAQHDPASLARVCGRCEGLNAFVWGTSALCLFIGLGFLLGAMRTPPAGR
jgi:hypothetical protein